MSEVSTLGLFLLDLGSLVATLEATNLNLKKRQVWFDKKTHRNLRDAAGGIVLAAWSADGPVSWPNLTERHLEKRFGKKIWSGQIYVQQFTNVMRRLLEEFSHQHAQGSHKVAEE